MTSLSNHTVTSSLTVGIDVAKATLEVGFSNRDATLAPANDEAGHAALLAHLAALSPLALVALWSWRRKIKVDDGEAERDEGAAAAPSGGAAAAGPAAAQRRVGSAKSP